MRQISKTVLVFLCVCIQLEAQEIVVIKTRNIPIVENIVNGFQSVCTGKHQLTIYDMEGKLHKGRDILSQIKEQNLHAILTIGLPATQLIKQSITDVPVVFTLVNDPEKEGFSSKNMSGISRNLPADIYLQYLHKALPETRRIAIIYSQKHSIHKARELVESAKKYQLNINLYQVSSVKDVPKTLRRMITENDALILIPDRIVINKSSLEYFVSTIMENGFPVLSYNNYLVKSGVLMGLSPDYLAMGQQAGRMLCTSRHLSQKINEPERFEFFVNSKTLKTIRGKIAPGLIDLADHVY